MNLQTYIDLSQLLNQKQNTHEENRAFGIKHKKLPVLTKLLAWTELHKNELPNPKYSDTFTSHLYHISLFLGALALVFGFFAGMGLLSYNGKAPVNLIYFLTIAVLLPLFSMFLSLISLLGINKKRNSLLHLSPAFWLDKIISLPFKNKNKYKSVNIDPKLLNYLVLSRAQMLAFFFSIGLSIALLLKVSTEDIAFAWSSTLQIAPESFHKFLNILSFPWHWLLPSSIPSADLVAHSHYFRLGGKLDSSMIADAKQLGIWWKFLAMATLFYAIITRVFVWLLVSLKMKYAIQNSITHIHGTKRLLEQMSHPIVSSKSMEDEASFTTKDDEYIRTIPKPLSNYTKTLGWALKQQNICLINDALNITTKECKELGGNRSIVEDNKTIEECDAEVLLYVKAWEPPMMDWVDMIDQLSKISPKITVLPLGTLQESYHAKPSDVKVWERKLALINKQKVWLCQNI